MGLLLLMGDSQPNVRSLFASNEAGFAYDIGDQFGASQAKIDSGLTGAAFKAAYPTHSLYQDSNGVTPAVYPNDPVGLVVDSGRGGLANLGPELVTNGGFDADSDWTKGANWTIGSGVATKTGGAANNLTQTITSTAGRWYRLTMDVTRTAGTLTVSIGTSGTTMAITASGSYTFFILAGSSTQTLTLAGDSSFAGTVDNVTARWVPGVHAYQTSSGSRPLLCRTPFGGRRNLLTGSDSLATQSVTVAAVEHTLSFQGTGTVTLSGVSTAGPLVGIGSSDIVSLTFTPTAGSLTLTVTGTVQFAQLERGDERTNYQKVTTTTDVTEAGNADCWGLLADGVDDFLVTPSINFNTWTQETRRNLLVDTESFEETTWTKVSSTATDNSAVAPDGTMTASTFTGTGAGAIPRQINQIATTSGTNRTFSVYAKKGTGNFIQLLTSSSDNGYVNFNLNTGTFSASLATGSITNVGNGWFRCEASFTVGTTINRIYITFIDSLAATRYPGNASAQDVYLWGAQLESGTLTDYQRVGTDKMTVMAGVRKLIDASAAVIAELTSVATNPGGFGIYDPSSGSAPNRTIGYRSEAVIAIGSPELLAPATYVATAQSNRAAPLITLRQNGVLVDTETGVQGVGNYANAVLYIMRRNGTSAPFSGIIYSLIVRGTQTPTGTIRDFEKLLAKRAGVTF